MRLSKLKLEKPCRAWQVNEEEMAIPILTETTENGFLRVPPNLQPFAEHLEFLGYENEFVDGLMSARQPNQPTLIYFGNDAVTQFAYVFAARDDLTAAERGRVCKLLNQWNGEAAVVKFFLLPEPEPGLWFSATYLGTYERVRFGAFLTTFMSETSLRLGAPELAQFMGKQLLDFAKPAKVGAHQRIANG